MGLVADTIVQTNDEGKTVVIQRQAIVVHQDPDTIIYKHFDLKERRVTKVSLQQGSLPYVATRDDARGRAQIVSLWERFGYTASVTDTTGKTTRVFDLYLDFYPPHGIGSLLEAVPARTTLPILYDGGGADEVDFSDISRIDFQGDRLKVNLTNGQVKTGKFLMPTRLPAEARFLGITSEYHPASDDVFNFYRSLAQLKTIQLSSGD